MLLPFNAGGSAAVEVRPFVATDAVGLWDLLREPLRSLYPGGDAWLSARVDSMRNKPVLWKASPLCKWTASFCYVAVAQGEIVGAAISSAKGRRYAKLSTLFVGENFHRQHVGERLMTACIRTWQLTNVDRVHVTVNETKIAAHSFFNHAGFDHVATARGRYFCDQDELIFSGATDDLWNESLSWRSTRCTRTRSMPARRHTSTAVPRPHSAHAIRCSYTSPGAKAW